WNREGTIIFGRGALYRVSASGGTAQAITALDKSLEEIDHASPWFFPDGRHFLYRAWSTKPENTAIYIGSLDSKNRVRLVTTESKALYSPPGFLLYRRERRIMVQPFDVNRLQLSGEAVPVAEDVLYRSLDGASAFTAFNQGTLVYQRVIGQDTQGRQEWMWMD